ncbi:2-oxoglutarate dehydrogenase, E2 component, dihydrolipoamide succinyltransferase [Acidobacteriia bacterium AH_259_A11_L15]|nr:2-oxoglutarate dehydrogenase, E2 component, dihydrolipoamide succinyltransferase [Acidobacteriia bacterium AH_259_A11_L15]
MPTEVKMPQMGESIFEGTITKWLKKPGEKVERDEPLFEISTDKVDAEIPAPASGVLKEIKVKEGATVEINTVVAILDDGGPASAEAPLDAARGEPAGRPPKKEKKVAEKPKEAKPAAKVEVPPKREMPPPAVGGELTYEPSKLRDMGIRTSPLVRKLAKEHGIDLRGLTGTGAGGRISKQDIERVRAEGVPAARPAVPAAPVELGLAVPRERLYFGRYEVEPMSAMRRAIAEHMVTSKRTSPHVYSLDEADMTRIAQLREKSKEKFERKTETKLTFMPFFIRACVEALRAFPTVNASVDGANLVLHKDVNIGIAVALDWGLLVPVIKSADELNFLGLQRALTDLATRARSKKLKPEEVQHSTFTITNPGVFGGLMGLPVINQPNVAILGLGAIQKRPVVRDDAIAIRSMVYITLSYDHRAVDGAVAHQFMGRVKKILEEWSEPIL